MNILQSMPESRSIKRCVLCLRSACGEARRKELLGGKGTIAISSYVLGDIAGRVDQ